VVPRIEHSGLMGNFGPSAERVKLWVDAGVSVKGAPEHVFVKLYTHGTQEDVMKMLFDDGGIETMLSSLLQSGISAIFVSAREMVKHIAALAAISGGQSE
jgi:hypothetical protein